MPDIKTTWFQKNINIQTFECGHSYMGKNAANKYVCKTKILTFLICGHSKSIYCYQKNEEHECTTNITYQGSCGHNITTKCFQKDNVKCETTLFMKYSCGHFYQVKCGDIPIE